MQFSNKNLTLGDRLFIDRRRENLSQIDAAEVWGVSLYKYRQWENDTGKSAKDAVCEDTPFVGVSPLKLHEKCVLMRRWSNRDASEIAKKLNVCRWWLTQMERGQIDASKLVEYWGIA